jgi:hypothetical protein
LIVETDYLDYELWASRLGEIRDLNKYSYHNTTISWFCMPGISKVLITGPEDIFEDLKFKLYRAEFDISINQQELTIDK